VSFVSYCLPFETGNQLNGDYLLEMAHGIGFPLKENGNKYDPNIIISKSFALPTAKSFTISRCRRFFKN
jgi:hypothetical protein